MRKLALPPQLNRRRALVVLGKIDEILAWEARHQNERDTKFVELGKYLCEVRAGPVLEAGEGQHFICAPWVHKARSMPREDFRRAVEKELTGKEEEPSGAESPPIHRRAACGALLLRTMGLFLLRKGLPAAV